MSEYVLNAAAMRVVEKNDKGIVTYRKRYKRGNVVDVSHIDPAHVEALVRTGRLVDADESEEGPETPDAPETQGEPTEPQGDGYDEMSYPDLQQEAKSRDLNAGGSADDLRARLRAFDAEESDEADDE